jgi:sensor c-di-GMP phosphodiesterase-like protein
MGWQLVRRTLLIVLSAAFGGLIAGSIVQAIQIRDGQVGLRDYAARLVRSEQQLTDDMEQVKSVVDHDGLPFCSDQELTLMRETVYRSANVRDLGRMRNNFLYCSTNSGRLPAPRNDTQPDLTIGTTHLYIDGPLLFSAHARGFVADMGGVSEVINPIVFKVLDAPPLFHSVLLYDRDRHVVVPAFGHAAPLSSEQVIAGGMVEKAGVFYVPTCPEHGMLCAVASESRSAMLEGNRGLVAGYLASGTLLGGAVGVIILLIYRRERSFERQLRRAIKTGDLTLVYQPVVDLDTGRIVAAEALVRWVNDRGETVKPAALVSIAEERGFVGEITTLVLSKAVEELGDLLSKGNFRITLNITAEDLMNDRFLPQLARSMLAAGVKARSIGLELTERSTVNQEAAIEALAKLKQAGHTVYIDDFGTGYSSLAYLHKLDAGAIKIDRVFTQTVGTQAVTASVVPQILDMASKLRLLVVVEGIETREQAEYFRAAGRGILGQGWFFGHPVPALQLLKLVQEAPETAPPL